MFLIKQCPRCGERVRFPIDRGKIKVTCRCGNSFIADPDDPGLYKDGVFDLSGKKKKQRSMTDIFTGRFSSESLRRQFSRFIATMLDLKYKIQNYRILPTSEQRKIMIAGVVIALIVFLMMVFLVCDSPFSVRNNEWTL